MGILTEKIRGSIQARLDKGESLNSVAKLTGVANPVLHRFMRGERTITLPTADKLWEALIEPQPKPKPKATTKRPKRTKRKP